MAFQNRAFNPNVEEIYENSAITSKTDCKNVERQKEGNVTQNENDSVLTKDHVYMQLYKPREIEIVARTQGSRDGPSLPPPQAQLPRSQLDEPNAEEEDQNQPRNNNVNEEPKYFTRRRLICLVVILFSILFLVLLLVILQSVGVIGYRQNREVQSQSSQGYFENTTILSGRLDYANLLEDWLKLVSRTKQWRRCWHGMTHGFAVSTFHSHCDYKGPTVTIVRVGSYIFGGYADQSWKQTGSCQSKTSSKSFIFTLYNTYGYIPQKLHLTSSSNHYYQYGIYACSSYGPTFGWGHDLYIRDNANTNTGSTTYSGYTYQAPDSCFQGHCSVFAGSSNSWTVSDIEVFYETS